MKKILSMALAGCILMQTGFCAQRANSNSVVEIGEDFQPGDYREMGAELNKSPADIYLTAYIQGLVDAHFPRSGVTINVHNGDAFISHIPNDPQLHNEITQYVESIVAQSRPQLENSLQKEASPTVVNQIDAHCDVEGIWLPQSTILYPTMVANPRAVMFSVGPRFGDCLGKHACTAVTFGDQFPIYRWTNVYGGDLQLELEAGVYALFSMVLYSAPLLNADYYVGIPLSYAKDKWAHRLRIYHISSHVGDEFLEMYRPKHFKRRNKSFEAIDYYASYQMNSVLRLYGGVGAIPFSDPEMSLKPFYVNYGFEARAFRHNFSQLYGEPFFAVDIQNAQENNFRFDTTYAVGYEWGKMQGIGRKIRIFAEYHHGRSPDGQFCRDSDEYFALRLAYGF